MTIKECVKDIAVRCDGAVEGIPKHDNGLLMINPDVVPVTIPHRIMSPVIRHPAAKEFKLLLEHLDAATGTISREYPISHLRALVEVMKEVE